MNHTFLRRLLILLIILLALGLPLSRARADVGPKPTIKFTFKQEFSGSPVTITSGTLLQCDLPDCSDAHPLPDDMGPQHFSCEALTCSGLAYGFTDYGKLEITFSDGKTRQSNIFAIKSFNSFYDVTIQENDLVVTERINPASLPLLVVFLCCCAGMLLVVAVIVGLVVFFARRKAAA
jgi:hypothetical protein